MMEPLPPLAAASHANTPTVSNRPTTARNDVAVAFDTALLGSLVETMLPKDSEAFGKGVGADIWRAQLAQAIGGQLARSRTLSFADLAGIGKGTDR